MRRFLFLSCLLATVVTALALLSPYSAEDVRDLGPEALRTAARLARQPHVTPTAEVDCDFCPQRIASCAAKLPTMSATSPTTSASTSRWATSPKRRASAPTS